MASQAIDFAVCCDSSKQVEEVLDDPKSSLRVYANRNKSGERVAGVVGICGCQLSLSHHMDRALPHTFFSNTKTLVDLPRHHSTGQTRPAPFHNTDQDLSPVSRVLYMLTFLHTMTSVMRSSFSNAIPRIGSRS
jgi:hypothetical protein